MAAFSLVQITWTMFAAVAFAFWIHVEFPIPLPWLVIAASSLFLTWVLIETSDSMKSEKQQEEAGDRKQMADALRREHIEREKRRKRDG